jgi:hypothetical protein
MAAHCTAQLGHGVRLYMLCSATLNNVHCCEHQCNNDCRLHTAITLQERASKQLPGPGQHFSFGAVKPWEDILAMLDEQEGEVQPGTRDAI